MADLSETAAFPFVCEGGLVLNQSTFIMKPGQALELENFEPDIDGGYKRINGFTKYVSAVVPITASDGEEVLMVASFADKVVAARGTSIYLTKSTTRNTEKETLDLLQISLLIQNTYTQHTTTN